MRHVSILLLTVAGLALGCGEVPPPAEEPALELGTGSWRFDALEDGQQVELVRGAQGGWHMWVSLRVRGVDMERPPIRLTVQPADESRPADETEIQLPFEEANSEGWRQRIGYTGIVEDPSCLVGELVRFRAELETPEGELLSSERDVMVMGGEYPPPPCGDAAE
jgi:hypothetical protein